MISGILGIVITGIVLYTAVLYKSTALALMGFSCALFIVLAYLFLRYRLGRLQCRIELPVFPAECGIPFPVRIYVENGSFFVHTKFKCCLQRDSRFFHKKWKKWAAGADAYPGENSYDYPVVFDAYGSYQIMLKKVRIYDLTGFFYLNKTVESSGFVQVFPKIQEIGVHLTAAVQDFFGDSDVYDESRPGHDRSELFQIRPFQDGDKIQSIHWKLSVKTDELLVKENSLPKACPIVFLLDYAAHRQKNAQKAGAYFRILAAVSFSLMDAGCPHYAAWYSGGTKDAVRFRVDDEESLYQFLCAYLEEPSPAESGNLQEMYQEKYRGERCLGMLRLNQQLELFLGQERIAAFTVKDLDRQLGELELTI